MTSYFVTMASYSKTSDGMMVDQELVDNETIYSSTMSSLSTEDYDTSTTFDELTTSPFPNPDPTTV